MKAAASHFARAFDDDEVGGDKLGSMEDDTEEVRKRNRDKEAFGEGNSRRIRSVQRLPPFMHIKRGRRVANAVKRHP